MLSSDASDTKKCMLNTKIQMHSHKHYVQTFRISKICKMFLNKNKTKMMLNMPAFTWEILLHFKICIFFL